MENKDPELLSLKATEKEARELLSYYDNLIIENPDNAILYRAKGICEYRLSLITSNDLLYEKSQGYGAIIRECFQKRINQLSHLVFA